MTSWPRSQSCTPITNVDARGSSSSEDGLTEADPSALRADRLLLYGVWDPSALLLEALERIRQKLPVTVLLPQTTNETSSATARWTAWAGQQEGTLEERPEHETTPPAATLVSAPDPSREIQETVRACLRWAQDGIPFHEMAVVYRHSEPYRPLLEAAFREASVPTYLHEGTPLTERPLGRRIAALLDLVEGDLERTTVMTFLADARLPSETWERYGKVSAAGWDTDSRRAGIVRGIEQWQSRLTATQSDLAQRGSETGAPSWLLERTLRVKALQHFIADLHQMLTSRRERDRTEGIRRDRRRSRSPATEDAVRTAHVRRTPKSCTSTPTSTSPSSRPTT